MTENTVCAVCLLAGKDLIPGTSVRHMDVDFYDHPHWALENNPDAAYQTGYAIGIGICPSRQAEDYIANSEAFSMGLADGEGDKESKVCT